MGNASNTHTVAITTPMTRFSKYFLAWDILFSSSCTVQPMVREPLHGVTSEAFPGSVQFPSSLASEDVDTSQSLFNCCIWDSVALNDCVAITRVQYWQTGLLPV